MKMIMNLHQYYYGENGNQFTDSIGLVHAYPHVIVRAEINTTRYVRSYEKEVEVIVH